MRTFHNFKVLVVFSHLVIAIDAMLSKRPLPDRDNDLPPAQKLKQNPEDLFLANDVSGARAQTIFADTDACGVEGFSRLARAGNRGRLKGNASRDLRRKIAKTKQWPDLYHARIRVYSPKLQQEVISWVPMMLPHEVIGTLVKFNGKAQMLQSDGLCGESARNLAAAKQVLQEADLMPLGLWCDGCPCNWDRTQSVEVWSMNLPGISQWQALRIPLAVIFKKYVVSEHTFDDILTVFSWSMQHLATGVYPSHRHDGLPFGSKDSKRKKLSGKNIGITAAIVEMRGDWKMLKEVFRLPGWNSVSGCCWRCKATPADIRSCGSDATWRHDSERLSHWDLLLRIRQQGHSVSPIFSFPAFTSNCYLIDWLRAVDLGVAADFLGNLFFMLLSKFPGANMKLRCSALFVELQGWYARNDVTSRLDNLTVSMIRQPKKPPKLRAKAAEARALVPFALEMAETKLSSAVPQEQAAQLCAKHLAKCYDCLSSSQHSQQVMADSCRSFCLLYCRLEARSENALFWRVKPKMHLMQELCERSNGSIPSMSWCYRDEDFGGTMSKLCRRRGGKNSPMATGTQALTIFFAKNPVPIL